MIGIVNLNMSLDKIYQVDTFTKGEVTRVKNTINMAGGKGTHVANICQELGVPYKLIGLIAGPTGEKVKGLLDDNHMNYEFVNVSSGDTRICLNIITEDDKSQTEFLESGLEITKEEKESFINLFKDLCAKSKIVVISGSGYKNMQEDFYVELCELAKKNNCRVIIDASGKNLLNVVSHKPNVIKPNKDEVSILSTGVDEFTLIKKLLDEGIELPIVSKGGEGAIAGYNGSLYKIKNPKIEIVNCVGSGDAFIGGIAVGLHEDYEIEDTLKLACACGTANALQLESGIIDKRDVERIKKETKIEKLDIK